MKFTVEVEEPLSAVLRQLGAKKRTTPEAAASSLLSAAIRSELKRHPRLAFESSVKTLADAARRRRTQKATEKI
jgi:hypothetical protein